jgi:hypothetical protein
MKTHVTFIHGIANKPDEQSLVQIWEKALATDQLGNDDVIDLGARGITTSMIYWADVLYGDPLPIATYESLQGQEGEERVASGMSRGADMDWRNDLTGIQRELVETLAAKLMVDVPDTYPQASEIELAAATILERIPLPWPLKKALMSWLLRDVHHYLFNTSFSPRPGASYRVQEEIRARVLKKLSAVEADRHIVLSHSMGTVIIYDCLKRVAECPAIDGLVTIGSPLGLDEIQDMLKPEWSRANGFPEKLRGNWVNVYDKLDPVAGFDGHIDYDYQKKRPKGDRSDQRAKQGCLAPQYFQLSE